MNLVEKTLDTRTRLLYNRFKSRRDIMYDDYDLDYASLSNDHYAYDLDEMCEHHMNNALRDMHNIQDTYENDDDDYARDTQDYVELAYKHYA